MKKQKQTSQPASQDQDPNQNSNQDQPESQSGAAQSETPYQAPEPPHLGAIAEPPPVEEEAAETDQAGGDTPAEAITTTAPAPTPGKRGRKPGGKNAKKGGSAVVADPYEPSPGEIEYAAEMTELVLWDSTEMMLDFSPPKNDVRQKIAKLEARLWKKHVAKQLSEEYMLAGLLLIWLVTNLVTWYTGLKMKGPGDAKRDNGDIRQETTRQNPFATPLTPGTH